MFRRILVPVDLAETDFAQPAVAAAVSLADDAAEIRLVHALPILPMVAADYLPATFDEERLQQARSELAAFAAAVTTKAKVTSCVRLGGPHHEIVAEAKDFGADLIVIASHRPGVATYIIGSTAASVVRHADCSVLIVRPPETAR